MSAVAYKHTRWHVHKLRAFIAYLCSITRLRQCRGSSAAGMKGLASGYNAWPRLLMQCKALPNIIQGFLCCCNARTRLLMKYKESPVDAMQGIVSCCNEGTCLLLPCRASPATISIWISILKILSDCCLFFSAQVDLPRH